ncbi:MAG TPA: hypothetical protein VG052_12090 [Puia sp.]|jgi:hypothetical protein|nr:hypothetical protein [Puia sp.]
MKLKILLATIGVSAFLLYLSSCSKKNAVQLSGGATCDTTNVKYSTQVLSILQNNCYVCHQGPGASSGIDFSNYPAFKGWAESGYVVGDITAAPNHIPMPYGLPKLSDCDINTIIAWIDQGMQNN